MTSPLIFVSTYKVKEGMAQDLEDYFRQMSHLVEAREPQVIAFNGFLNEDGTELTSIQVHPDAASMETHMQVIRDAWDESFGRYTDFLEESLGVAYYGTPAETALRMDQEAGVPIELKPRHIGGFTRAPER